MPGAENHSPASSHYPPFMHLFPLCSLSFTPHSRVPSAHSLSPTLTLSPLCPLCFPRHSPSYRILTFHSPLFPIPLPLSISPSCLPPPLPAFPASLLISFMPPTISFSFSSLVGHITRPVCPLTLFLPFSLSQSSPPSLPSCNQSPLPPFPFLPSTSSPSLPSLPILPAPSSPPLHPHPCLFPPALPFSTPPFYVTPRLLPSSSCACAAITFAPYMHLINSCLLACIPFSPSVPSNLPSLTTHLPAFPSHLPAFSWI
ncbi:unnamed protein product [Closterium sp. Naga37s-1]|nr:unnamed protein product [Closterium sp. Naga37s-1]